MKNSYINALNISKNRLEKLQILDNRFAFFRLVFTIGILAAFVPLAQGKELSFIIFLVLIFLFSCLFLSIYHKKLQNKQGFWQSVLRSYHLSEARSQRNFNFLEENKSPWHDKVNAVPLHHIYAHDLDIKRELFLFMNSCSTEGGSNKLFQLLLSAGKAPPNKNEVQRWMEVTKKLSLRKSLLRRFECLRLNDEFIKSYYKMLENSANANTELTSSPYSFFFYAFVSIVSWIFLFLPIFFNFREITDFQIFLKPLLIYAFVILTGIFIFQPLTHKISLLTKTTKYIALILKNMNFKEYPYDFLKTQSEKKIARINFYIDILSLRGNPVFWLLIHILFPFDAFFCTLLFFIFERIKKDLPIWQKEIDEFDLLVSFARLKAENHEFNFFSPKDEQDFSSTVWSVVQIGHPLLPLQKRICNSITLTKEAPLILLTGSNMSGKSTFLRTFATNSLLYNMGAPVCAEKFSLPRVQILCAIRIDDSLIDGTSYFYAEVKRLAEILQTLKSSSSPALFFIDEIFKGTNNKERFLGSLSIIKALLNTPYFGFVSTHDLALTDLAKEELKLRNMHFREFIQENKLFFDYKLKEGPCPTTNAIFIMKIAGLPV